MARSSSENWSCALLMVAFSVASMSSTSASRSRTRSTMRVDDMIFARAHARLVDDPVEARRLWASELLPNDQSLFWSSARDPELQFVELMPERVSIAGTDHTAPPAVWRRPTRV